MTSDATGSGAPVGLREKARIERYQNIRAAAERLFNERGYEHTTTKEVAELAGVGEATLFRYISNKYELLLLVIGERMDMALEAIEDADELPAIRVQGGKPARGAEHCPGRQDHRPDNIHPRQRKGSRTPDRTCGLRDSGAELQWDLHPRGPAHTSTRIPAGGPLGETPRAPARPD